MKNKFSQHFKTFFVNIFFSKVVMGLNSKVLSISSKVEEV